MNINSQCDWMKVMLWTNLRFSLLMYRLIKRFSFEKMSMVFKYKTLIANVLVRTLVCKPTASPGSQGKMCRAGFLRLLIANVLDRTPYAKWEQDLCISWTQTVLLDDPCATTYKQFGKICICHIGYVAICQTGNIDICWSSNIAICQPCNTVICQNMKLKITSSI